MERLFGAQIVAGVDAPFAFKRGGVDIDPGLNFLTGVERDGLDFTAIFVGLVVVQDGEGARGVLEGVDFADHTV